MFTRISKGVLIFYFIAVVFIGLALLAGDKGEKEIGAIVLGVGLVVGYGFGLFVELINNVLDIRINSEKILSKVQSYEQNNSLLGNGMHSNLSSNGNAGNAYTQTNVSNSSSSLLGNAGGSWTCRYCYSTNEPSHMFCMKCGERRNLNSSGNGSGNTSTPYSSVDVSNSSSNLLENAQKDWTCKSCNNTNESSYHFCIKCGARR